MFRSRRRWLWLLVAAGCLGCAETPTPAGGPLFEERTPRYAVLVHAEGGAAGALELELAPQAPYKLATEFPIRLTFDPESADARSLGAEQATRYTESGAAFSWTPAPGAATELAFAFGVCETDICEPIELRIALDGGR